MSPLRVSPRTDRTGADAGQARKIKSRGVKAEKKAAEEVLNEVLPDGPKRFPMTLSSAATTATKTSVDFPEAPLVFDNSPLFAGCIPRQQFQPSGQDASRG